MEKFDLLISLNIDGVVKEIPIINSDLMSLEYYTSYCKDFEELLRTIKYTRTINEGKKKRPNSIYLKLYNFIKENTTNSEQLRINTDIPVFYYNDSDIVFCTPDDITRLVDNSAFSGALVLRELKKIGISNSNWGKENRKKLLEECYLDKQKWFLFLINLKKITKSKFKVINPDNTIDSIKARRNLVKNVESNVDLVSQIYTALSPFFGKENCVRNEKQVTKKVFNEELDDNYILEFLKRELQKPDCTGKEKTLLLTMISLYEKKNDIVNRINYLYSSSKNKEFLSDEDELRKEKLDILLADTEYKLELLNNGEYHFTDGDEIEFDYAKEYNDN